MRLCTYRAPGEPPRAGAVVEDRVVDLAADLLDVLRAGPATFDASGDGRPLSEVELLAPLPRPPKLLAAAANYQAHIAEGGLPPVDKRTIVPKLFLKPSSAIIGPDAVLTLPSVSSTVDWELELAVVMGQGQVAGYTIINDISARTMDWGLPQRDPTHWDGFFDWLNGKWGDGFAPMGPWIVTADELSEPLRLRLSVNGEVRQEASTGDMIFGVDELVAFASRFMTLEPGDVIATGTPAGVGATDGTYLKAGDRMEGWIEGIGTLRTLVA